jgi:hypothetical protein
LTLIVWFILMCLWSLCLCSAMFGWVPLWFVRLLPNNASSTSSIFLKIEIGTDGFIDRSPNWRMGSHNL